MFSSTYAPAAAAPAPTPAAPPPPRAARASLGPSPYAELDRPLFTPGHVAIPKSDGDVKALVIQSKAVLAHQDQRHAANTHPAQVQAYQRARQAHIEAAVQAVQEYHDKNPTPFSQQVLDAIHSDPGLKVSHLKKAPKK